MTKVVTPTRDREAGAVYSRAMNMLSPRSVRLAVDVVFDLVCPWCWIGVRRLTRTVARRPDLSVEITYRPFLLNPDMPARGMARAEYLQRKFGGEERARRLHAAIAEVGRSEGIGFRFDRIGRTPSTIEAHRLVRLAGGEGRAAPLVDALFAAHFCEGRDIGDRGTLAAIWAETGLAGEPATHGPVGFGTDAVHADNLRAHRLGINGVPCFVFGERHAIAGAQEPEVLERMLDIAALENAGV
ncbi:DsbA family oxidoreductase [Elioraea sp.]|uniref:DsbA family oxidoreductase n=1 Tax=Elioraea sp. TaxID=2185103 RepID=UPI0034592701